MAADRSALCTFGGDGNHSDGNSKSPDRAKVGSGSVSSSLLPRVNTSPAEAGAPERRSAPTIHHDQRSDSINLSINTAALVGLIPLVSHIAHSRPSRDFFADWALRLSKLNLSISLN